MHQNHWIWISMLVVLLTAHSVHGLVWSLVLGNPVIDMKDESSGLADPGADDLAESLEDSDDVQHPRNTRLKLQSGSRPTRHHQHSSQQEKCLEDRQCGKGRFCDLHYGVCRTEKSPGFACRRDRMCAKGLACMYGRCQAKIPTGEEGSRCHANSDCEAGLCCARRHGENVCQRKLTLGQRCFVPDGGLEYSLNQLCPCDVGLVCQQQNATDPASNSFEVAVNNQTNPEVFPFWTSTDNMRCQFHEMVPGSNRAGA